MFYFAPHIAADRNSETESHTGNSGSEDNIPREALSRKEAGKNTGTTHSHAHSLVHAHASHSNSLSRGSTPGLNGASSLIDRDRPMSPHTKDLKTVRSSGSGVKKTGNKKARYR